MFPRSLSTTKLQFNMPLGMYIKQFTKKQIKYLLLKNFKSTVI